jgi:hypothetical protein
MKPGLWSADILSASGKPANTPAGALLKVVRVARSGGQDVRDPLALPPRFAYATLTAVKALSDLE